MRGRSLLGRPACFACRARVGQLARSRNSGAVLSSWTPSRPSRTSSPAFSTSAGSASAADGAALGRQRPDSGRRTRLPDTPARTRFAPSPTGYLHLGSLRTALYNYLLARATNGQFLLRLEDTDQSRVVPDAESRLYEDLKWAGLSWDEGPDCGGPYGPYKQSERLSVYRAHADRLLHEGKAFRCFCSHDALAAHQQRALQADGAAAFGAYPGRCLALGAGEAAARAAAGEPHTVRFRSGGLPGQPGRPAAAVDVYDVVYGRARRPQPADDHFILMKSDGFPTYHFANVVDDHLMAITHVVRGAEWLISTPKHVALYHALGWAPPVFAHVGLLVDAHRQKLSKRNMDIGIDAYRRAGLPPPALLNFAALLGWNPGALRNKGVMTLDEMVQDFSLKFTKGDIVVNLDKLDFFHRKHIRRALDAPSSSGDDVVDEFLVRPMLQQICAVDAARPPHLGRPLFSLADADAPAAHRRLRALLQIARSDAVAAAAVVEANRFVVWRPSAQHIAQTYAQLAAAVIGRVRIDGDDAGRPNHSAAVPEVLAFFLARLRRLDDAHWTVAHLKPVLDETTKAVTCRPEGEDQQQQQPVSVGYKYLRWALLGLDNGPQIAPLMAFLGRDEVLARLEAAEEAASTAASHGGHDHVDAEHSAVAGV